MQERMRKDEAGMQKGAQVREEMFRGMRSL
jgi:hypothetical protein